MDARVRYTKMMIKEQFILLLKEQPLNKITVKAICQNAQINRATFYKYYDNPYDLLNKLEQEFLDDLQQKILQQNTAGFQDILRIVLQDVRENRFIYSVLFSENGDAQFREHLFALCYHDNMETIRSIFPKLPPIRQEWLYYFIAEGCNGILNQWMAGGMKEDPEDIVNFIDKVVLTVNMNLAKRYQS